ncbi:MAG TPA: DUF11 domain-containing protein [Solirubrobacterales bacterium]|nr:DUF11 domain-containing protein [Solirubrobacterales bacterium]
MRRALQLGCALGILAILVSVASAAAGQPAKGSAAGGTGLLVTVAARECHSYQDVTANLARNNIMESLRDLGADTLYTSGQPINPQIEAEGQPKCEPITGWKFTLGSGIKEKASTGPWGALSIVTGAESPLPTTEASTPLLGWNGETIPGQTLHGATTFELNKAQAERAPGQRLWIQGGTTTDPVLYESPKFEGKYGFAALRCSIDDLNGDNVEYIKFPVGTTHAFCYAYYVTPPPESGTIVIRKEVEGGGSAPQEFQFGGNVSYNPGGVFSLSAAPGKSGEQVFYRGETRTGEEPWKVNEAVPDGWQLAHLRCESKGSQVDVDQAKAEVSIRLAAADTVTCTYVDRFTPPKGELLLRKVTEGGTGTFDFRVLDASGDTVESTSIKTTDEGTPAYAGPFSLDPGTYKVVEHSPHDPAGEWHPVGASCNGDDENPGDEVSVKITASEGALCTFTNRLVHPGRITIRKETVGGTGSAGFQITYPADPTVKLDQVAKVEEERKPVLADGDPTDALALGKYVIQEYVAQAKDPAGWALIEVECDGKVVPFDQGRVTVRLTHSDPHVNCKFLDRYTPRPTPEPPGPGPEPGRSADVAVEKTLIGSTGGAVPVNTYRIDIHNRSDFTATDVSVTDQPGPGLVVVSAEPSGGGSCVQVGDFICTFPSIAPHGTETIIVKAKDYGSGTSVNRAILGSSAPDNDGSDDVDGATAEAPSRNFPACGSSVRISARC